MEIELAQNMYRNVNLARPVSIVLLIRGHQPWRKRRYRAATHTYTAQKVLPSLSTSTWVITAPPNMLAQTRQQVQAPCARHRSCASLAITARAAFVTIARPERLAKIQVFSTANAVDSVHALSFAPKIV